MLFRNRHRRREENAPLTNWALSQRESDEDLVDAFGAEHSEELGTLGWVFRAIEALPWEAPALGEWQRFDRDLRQRIALLPSPRMKMAVVAPILFLPTNRPQDFAEVVSDMVLKASAVAAATLAITYHLVDSGTLNAISQQVRERAETNTQQVTEIEPAHPLIQHLERNRRALAAGRDGFLMARTDNVEI